MGIESDILKLVCNRLEQLEIPYMLTGSFAANMYAVPRMTRDIDIVIEIFPIDISNVHHIDRNYISEWVKKLHLEDVYKVVTCNE